VRSRKTRLGSDLTSHLDVSDARRERRGELGTRQREFSISSAFSISDAISDGAAPTGDATPTPTPTPTPARAPTSMASNEHRRYSRRALSSDPFLTPRSSPAARPPAASSAAASSPYLRGALSARQPAPSSPAASSPATSSAAASSAAAQSPISTIAQIEHAVRASPKAASTAAARPQPKIVRPTSSAAGGGTCGSSRVTNLSSDLVGNTRACEASARSATRHSS
jgi:hypothetical protein